MTHITVKELVGVNAMTPASGDVIFHQIHDVLARGETVELDFGGVERFASPFFNVGIGRLLADLDPDFLKEHLKFQHISAMGDRILRRVIENALEYYKADQKHREAIDRIVRDTAAAM